MKLFYAQSINKDKTHIILNPKEILNKKHLDCFNSLIERRKKGEPIAYLTNKKEFLGQMNFM